MDELTPYEQCLDLQALDDVYCSKDSGVINGNVNGLAVIFGMLAAWAIVTALVKEHSKKPR